MMLIDADALMRAVMEQDVVDKSVAKRLIIQAPTVDAVQVVRCKDCKHYRTSDAGHPDCDYCNRLICGTVRPDFYCADGERREG